MAARRDHESASTARPTAPEPARVSAILDEIRCHGDPNSSKIGRGPAVHIGRPPTGTVGGMTERYARAERHALADTLLAAGPDAPTLCEGWATRDLAAHLVLRERRPDAAAGILFKP